jgi:phospholipid/cholesterol/gamma-HCH transport system substrate-binding protein
VLQVTPRGDGDLSAPIPLERTRSPYQLPDALGDLSTTVSGLDTNAVSDALATLSQTFQDTPPDLKAAVDGVARFSQTLDTHDQQLRNLLANANKATTVLSERADQVAGLVADTTAFLAQLQTQSAALDQISGNLSAFAKQLSGFIGDNRTQLRPALDKLNGVLTIVDNRKERIQQAIKSLNAYAMSLGEAVASGPFFKAYLGNLLPGQFVQPFVDAAFSDLGLDPNVLLPSQRVDPPTGQPATPALPVPYPRTGQGGDPNLTLPDAITGKPGDQQCGPPGVALPGPVATPTANRCPHPRQGARRPARRHPPRPTSLRHPGRPRHRSITLPPTRSGPACRRRRQPKEDSDENPQRADRPCGGPLAGVGRRDRGRGAVAVHNGQNPHHRLFRQQQRPLSRRRGPHPGCTRRCH